ncbi:YfiR family protein [Flexithrix dorotheae]|uniref:YfiR family protein n=1 Tax=Flexithrix dorotheae TaxID=70993 RepID=UPI0003731567|nr:YfiR family protein [Flexithrix dorotheae]
MKNFSNQFIKTVLLAAICALSLFGTSFSQTKGEFKDGYQVRRMFIYHFTRYIEWPDDNSTEDFVIGVLNDDKMYATLNQSFEGRKRKNRPIKVVKFKSTSEVENCSILFLPKYQSKNLESLIDQFEGKNTLLITDKNGLGEKGSTINFHEVGNKLRFELNLEALEKASLKVSGQLKQVAILI